jgi:UDP-glucose 4-epimerase
VPVRAARFFNIYGPRETNPHLIPEIIEQAKKSDIVELGNMDTKRDFIFVADIVAGVIALLENVDPSVKFDSYNIGSGVEYNAHEIVAALAAAMDRPNLRAISVPERYRASDRMHLCSNNAKLKSLGWTPQYDLEKGLRELVEFESATAKV